MKYRILESVSLAAGPSYAPGQIVDDLPEGYESAPWAEPLDEAPKKAAPKTRAKAQTEKATEPPVETATV